MIILYQSIKIFFTNLTLICKKHGIINTTPYDHLRTKYGCSSCAIEARVNSKKININSIIEAAKKQHKNKYQYIVPTITRHGNDKIKVICPDHGAFLQTIKSIKSNKICRLCSEEKNRLSQDEYINICIRKHGNKYIYSDTVYINSRTNVTVGCPDHGSFSVIAAAHSSGSGCPVCKESKGEKTIAKILNSNNILFKREYRIPKSKQRYRYDFWLPDYNLLIEFHGGQHYFPIEYFGGEKRYKETKERDIFKAELAKFANFNFIVFNYKDLRLPYVKFEAKVLGTIQKFKLF